mmetsp:Transcript_47038/g.93122  ORF Transcript_47038/g.93122 Transcript_47038/m.93122 type:complete len:205 (+) Transcript_47038:736-1350(+)
MLKNAARAFSVSSARSSESLPLSSSSSLPSPALDKKAVYHATKDERDTVPVPLGSIRVICCFSADPSNPSPSSSSASFTWSGTDKPLEASFPATRSNTDAALRSEGVLYSVFASTVAAAWGGTFPSFWVGDAALEKFGAGLVLELNVFCFIGESISAGMPMPNNPPIFCEAAVVFPKVGLKAGEPKTEETGSLLLPPPPPKRPP